MKARITDKKLANKNFRKTEEAILKVFFRDEYICANRLAKEAGVARGTVYHHHDAVRNIIPDYEYYLIAKYRSYLTKISKTKDIKLESLFTRMLLFMVMQKRFFVILKRGGDARIIGRMIDCLRKQIIRRMMITRKRDDIFEIYKSEITTLVKTWCEEGFDVNEIGKMVENMVYLAETARMRLGVLK